MSLPVIVGVGQSVAHWAGDGKPPTPVSLARDAITAALADSGADIASQIDWMAFVRLFQDSIKGNHLPHGTYSDPASTIADAAGLTPKTRIHSIVGGDQPQVLVGEAAATLLAGEARVALITGAEAMSAGKVARRARQRLDWTDDRDLTSQDRGLGPDLLTAEEISAGLGTPMQTYALFDHALRARWRLSKAAYRKKSAEMLEHYARVANENPFSMFRGDWDAETLARPDGDNRPVADPYLKWHVAQDAVNQGAAVILTTDDHARSLGIPENKWVYLHAHAEATDVHVSAREDHARSVALEKALDAALGQARLTPDQIAHFDLYNCFPSVPFLAAEHLGLDPLARPLTVTGGLSFFGGPGNNYSLHAIATMVETLRRDRDSYGLILANGGFMTHEAVGIYAAFPPDGYDPGDPHALSDEIAAGPQRKLHHAKTVVVEGYTVVEGRFGPAFAYVAGRTETGRVIAKVRKGHRATMENLKRRDPLGHQFELSEENGMSYVNPTDKLGTEPSDAFWARTFEHILVERNGHILEITLNRPERFNALHGPAHYELHEVFDGFEHDQDLWVAIITGAGEKAFCSGNDLKATAEGQDIQPAASGFGGLCTRFGREKPVIAAVNGVAMGGGAEIMLACDLAVAAPTASFALPEVKVGLFAAAGGVQRLSRQIGRKKAMELILTGRTFSAHKADELGVINGVCGEDETVMDYARRLAEEICAVSPSSIRTTKRVLNFLEEDVEELERSYSINMPEFGKLMKTNDGREGVKAFVEKRKPNWTNS